MDGDTVWCKFHNPNFNRFSMIHPSDEQTDKQTDGRAIAYTRYSIYAVARKNCRISVGVWSRELLLLRQLLSECAHILTRCSPSMCVLKGSTRTVDPAPSSRMRRL